MIRISLILATLCGGVLGAAAEPLRPSGPVDAATVEVLAMTYTFGPVEVPLVGCVVTLKATPHRTAGRFGYPVAINAACREHFSWLRTVSRWEPTGGGSLRLLGGAPFRELADFSPVQDGTGVYLHGGFAGHLYELRPPQE